jgi:hypothetical protein
MISTNRGISQIAVVDIGRTSGETWLPIRPAGDFTHGGSVAQSPSQEPVGPTSLNASQAYWAVVSLVKQEDHLDRQGQCHSQINQASPYLDWPSSESHCTKSGMPLPD